MDADRAVEQMRHKEANVIAFLRMIRACEGTDAPDGYRYLFGSTHARPRLFDGYDTHPRRRVMFKNKKGQIRYSSAAGAYQIIAPTFDDLMRRFPGRWHDFTPQTQDEMAIELIKQRGAMSDVACGRFQDAVVKTALEWASLPSGPYIDEQSARSWTFTLAAYQDAGGVVA